MEPSMDETIRELREMIDGARAEFGGLYRRCADGGTPLGDAFESVAEYLETIGMLTARLERLEGVSHGDD